MTIDMTPEMEQKLDDLARRQGTIVGVFDSREWVPGGARLSIPGC